MPEKVAGQRYWSILLAVFPLHDAWKEREEALLWYFSPGVMFYNKHHQQFTHTESCNSVQTTIYVTLYTTGEEKHLLPTLSWLQTHLHCNIQVQLLLLQEHPYWLKSRLCVWQSNPSSESSCISSQRPPSYHSRDLWQRLCQLWYRQTENDLTYQMGDTDCHCVSARVLSPAQPQTLCVDMLYFIVAYLDMLLSVMIWLALTHHSLFSILMIGPGANCWFTRSLEGLGQENLLFSCQATADSTYSSLPGSRP